MEQEVKLVYSIKQIEGLDPEKIAWRRLNFNRLYYSRIDIYPAENKIILTTELSAEYSKSELIDWVTNHTYLEYNNSEISISLIDLFEEKEIYENE
jgi:hypothetical protein